MYCANARAAGPPLNGKCRLIAKFGSAGMPASVSRISRSAGTVDANHAVIARSLLTVAVVASIWRDYASHKRFGMLIKWHAIMPALTAVLGYFLLNGKGHDGDVYAMTGQVMAVESWKSFEHSTSRQIRLTCAFYLGACNVTVVTPGSAAIASSVNGKRSHCLPAKRRVASPKWDEAGSSDSE